MRVFRLLDMVIEIGREKIVKVKRPDCDFLLSIKSGKCDYDKLPKMTDDKQTEMEEVFMASTLPDKPNLGEINKITYLIREKLYQEKA